MKTIQSSIKMLAISVLFIAALVVATSAIAIGQNASTTSQGQQDAQSSQPSQAQAIMSGKLDDAKKKICEQSEAKIQNTFKNINESSQTHLNTMNKISEKVQVFYQNKSLEAANYEELVAEVTRTQTQAQNAIQASVQTSSQFGCSQDNPKETANQYKVQVKEQITFMK